MLTLIDENTGVRCDGRICYDDKYDELRQSTVNARTALWMSYPPTFRLCDQWRGSSSTGTSSIFDGYDIELSSDIDSNSFLGGRASVTGTLPFQ